MQTVTPTTGSLLMRILHQAFDVASETEYALRDEQLPNREQFSEALKTTNRVLLLLAEGFEETTEPVPGFTSYFQTVLREKL